MLARSGARHRRRAARAGRSDRRSPRRRRTSAISFTDGTFRGAYLGEKRRLEVQEVEDHRQGHERRSLHDRGQQAHEVPLGDHRLRSAPPRLLPARRAHAARAHGPSRTRSSAASRPASRCTEPLYGPDQRLRRGAHRRLRCRRAVDRTSRDPRSTRRARSCSRGDGIILAYPVRRQARRSRPATSCSATRTSAIPRSTALFASIAKDGKDRALRFLELEATDGAYLTSVARSVASAPASPCRSTGIVATVVPERTLLGPTHALERSSRRSRPRVRSRSRCCIALVLAWNLVRMRRQVAASREEARSAEQRAQELGCYRLVAQARRRRHGRGLARRAPPPRALRGDQADPPRGPRRSGVESPRSASASAARRRRSPRCARATRSRSSTTASPTRASSTT